jgi:DNA-directed RNA polymerase subunit beta
MPQTMDRQNWGQNHQVLPKLDLIELQINSYQDFLNNGIKESLKEINSDKGIEDFTGKNWSLKFGQYRFGQAKYTPTEAKTKNVSYDQPLYVEATLLNKKTGEERTQEVFLGDIPAMTNTGTFVINGIERGIVTQLVRSPGVFFSGEEDQSSKELLYKAELRPMRGSWLEINVSRRHILTIKIDRRRKMPATVLLRALGWETNEDIANALGEVLEKDKLDLINNTLRKDSTTNQAEALIELYEKMRPGEPAVLETAREFLKNMFFNPRRYDLGEVGRYKMNRRLGISLDEKLTVLAKDDVLASIKYLIKLQNGEGKVDDIDHLSNRRVRQVGELVLISAFRIGLIRLERSIREKMSLTKTDEVLTPSALVNARPLIASIAEFFRRNRLSTILDQTNPLSEIDNLRRLSVMGTGGVTRDRASFSMRDINASQYSRICPIRSPEGPNIGLVTYLALYTKVNKYGFLEAPYFKVIDFRGKMKVTDEIVYLSADEEEDYYITHAGVKIDDKGYITQDWVPMRHANEFIEGSVKKVEYIDVVPRQVVGSSASLIPFIAHDEANRALMGSHMQCQAVPLLKTQAPIIGTGMEKEIASAMGWTVLAEFPGEIQSVDASEIVLKIDPKHYDKAKNWVETNKDEHVSYQQGTLVYTLNKFARTAQSTCYNQTPEVKVGDKLKKGDVLIDGPATDKGELALGTNLLIAYTLYNGLGYEDAIVISDRLVKEDTLSSIQISEHKAKVMDTRLGPEELTNDIPNVSETFLANLNIDGIIQVGSHVKSGDILVGKVAPKGETELSPEERLLRAIFGEKSKEIRDTSLRMPHGDEGTVIDVQILDRDLGDELDPGTIKEVIVKVAQLRKIVVGDKLAGRHGNKGVISKIVPQADMPHLEDGTPVDIIVSPLSVLARMNLGQLLEAHLGWAADKLGYSVATPAFEVFDEDKIWQELEKAGLPVSGKAQLYDGLTGEPYHEKSVVGINYILKLSHMVEDKTHARSTGPYSLVTQQPLGGKAQMGGQRMGEMEVWALEAHRAAYVLQEMLTIKSDDVRGRAKAFEAIVKGEEIPAPTVPESFKVLCKELNSLALNIDPLEEVVLSDEEPTAEKDQEELLILEDLDSEKTADKEEDDEVSDEEPDEENIDQTDEDEEDDLAEEDEATIEEEGKDED